MLGAVTGVMGTLQATEVLKEILGIGESLSGKLLIWDALATRFRTVRLRQDPHCALCGPDATIRDLSAHADARGARLCRLNRWASCCCRARMTARITRSCSPRARRRWGATWCCSPPTPAATRCSTDWSGLTDAARDARVRAAGVAGLEELREATREMGVRLIACEAGLRAEGLDASGLLPGVEVAGIATFLAAVGSRADRFDLRSGSALKPARRDKLDGRPALPPGPLGRRSKPEPRRRLPNPAEPEPIGLV